MLAPMIPAPTMSTVGFLLALASSSSVVVACIVMFERRWVVVVVPRRLGIRREIRAAKRDADDDDADKAARLGMLINTASAQQPFLSRDNSNNVKMERGRKKRGER